MAKTKTRLKTVRITVEGGVVQNVRCPRGIRAVVKDYDTDGADRSRRDGDGNYYVRTEYAHGGVVIRGR